MPDYTITTHVELPGKPEPVRSGLIRLRIPADSELEAKAKAERYVRHKLAVVFDSCQEEQPEKPFKVDDDIAGMFSQFGTVFGKKP